MPFSKPSFFTIIAAAILCLCPVSVSYADILVMRNNDRVKGVIVEDYKDRIVIRTVEGEKQIMKKDIRRIMFDMEEQNLTSLGDFHQDMGRYIEAYYYYERALEVNPDYKKAREGFNYVGAYLHQTGRRLKLDHIRRRQEEERWKEGVPLPAESAQVKQVRDSLGIVLKDVKGTFEIADVVPDSPAVKAGIRKGDILLATWGRNISYMRPGEVMAKLVNSGIMDVRATIERSFMLELGNSSINYSDLLGAQLRYSEMEGLMVEKVVAGGAAEAAGIKEGDILLEIQGESTRYMPFKDVARIINSRKRDTLSLKIKRDVVVWKEQPK